MSLTVEEKNSASPSIIAVADSTLFEEKIPYEKNCV